MRIVIMGTGYVGLVSGICFAEFGFNVTCIDIDADKIQKLQRGQATIYEPGLQDLLQKNIAEQTIKFSTDLVANLDDADLIMLAIGTPSRDDGSVDLSFINKAAVEIASNLSKYTPIVIKSTVPPGTCRALKAQMSAANPHARFDVISNPEFLREGAAIHDFMQPDRIVIGLDNMQNRELMTKLYKPLQMQQVPIVYTTLETSELIKYASNALLATKIAFINEMADLCEQVSGDVQVLANAVGLDKRIGPHFLQAGPGYGGSCFPKDTLGLQNFAQSVNTQVSLIDAVIAANDRRKQNCVQKILDAYAGNVAGIQIAVLGVAFKGNTDDIRESPALPIISGLLENGAVLRLYDPQALTHAREHFGEHANLRYTTSVKECLCNAHAALVLTEWNEFRDLDLNEVSKLLCVVDDHTPRTFIDLRNLYCGNDFTGLNLRYVSIGRPVTQASTADLQVNLHEY